MNNLERATRILEDLEHLISNGNTELMPTKELVEEFREGLEDLKNLAQIMEDVDKWGDEPEDPPDGEMELSLFWRPLPSL